MRDGQRLQGVIFDMDGVLCDSEPVICAAAQAMFRERYGVDVPAEDFRPFVGTGEDRYLGGTAAKHGIALRLPEDKVRTYEIYLAMIPGRLHPLPGVAAFVRDCRAAGLRLAVASSADRMKVAGNLAELGLPPERFDAVVTGSDVARKKPHPDIFQLAAERIAVPPELCLVVEDAINGVQAAKAAGAACLGLTTSFAAEQLREVGADATGPHLGEVPAAVRGWLGLAR